LQAVAQALADEHTLSLASNAVLATAPASPGARFPGAAVVAEAEIHRAGAPRRPSRAGTPCAFAEAP